MVYCNYLETPIGLIRVTASNEFLETVDFVCEKNQDICENDITNIAIKQLEEYFLGTRKIFTVPLNIRGTNFQKSVYNELLKIQYAEVKTYKEIAEKITTKKAYRAVGLANHVNPLGIVVPCHRVVGTGNKLVGYASGIENKQWLLNHEKSNN